MKIEKVLNNNVVVALDENGAETVLMGRGLGFGRRAGDEAPPDKIEKRFHCTRTSFPTGSSSSSRASRCRIS